MKIKEKVEITEVIDPKLMQILANAMNGDYARKWKGSQNNPAKRRALLNLIVDPVEGIAYSLGREYQVTKQT